MVQQRRCEAGLHASASVAAAYRTTWFTLQYDEQVTSYDKGGLPGDPEVDLLFTAAIREALDEIHRELLAAGLLHNLPTDAESLKFSGHVPGQEIPPDVSYVDDTVFLLGGYRGQNLRSDARGLRIGPPDLQEVWAAMQLCAGQV